MCRVSGGEREKRCAEGQGVRGIGGVQGPRRER